MQEPRPTSIANSASKSKRAGGYVSAALGVVIIAINVFFIITLKGQVPTLTKALLPLGCILIIAGCCFCCIKEPKPPVPRPQYQTPTNYATTHHVNLVMHQNSVPENDDLPPTYEDCVAVDVNNHNVLAPSYSWTTNCDSANTGGVSNSGGGGDCGNSSSCAIDSAVMCDSRGRRGTPGN